MGTLTNVIVGVADLYLAPANTPAPSFDTTGLVTPPTTPWDGVGFTEQGVDLEVDLKTNDIDVEEQPTPAAVTLETLDIQVACSFAEDTLQNALYAYGTGKLTVTAPATGQPGTTALTLDVTLNTVAVCFIGKNSFGLDRLFYVPTLVSTGKVKTSYRRAKSARLYPASFRAICAPTDIAITDATAVGS